MESKYFIRSTQNIVLASLKKIISKIVPELSITSVKLQDPVPSQLSKYDYISPSLLQIYNQNKKVLQSQYGTVKDMGVKLLEQFQEDEVIRKLEIDEKTFLQITLQESFIERELNNLLLSDNLEIQPPEKPFTVAVDFSSPNIAKELHVGHLRSSIIGESICRIFEYQGLKTHRINHVGDWGTQFGMLITQLREQYPNFLNNLPDITSLTQFYQSSKKRFDEDETFKKVSQDTVVKLQQGDVECRKAWELICNLSRQEYEKLYKRLDIHLKETGESFYNDMIPEVVKECEQKGLVTIDEGAKCIFVGKPFKIPLMVIKSNGGYGYDSTDLACIKYRTQHLKADRLVYITDLGQEQHFHMIFKAAELMGWTGTDGGIRVEHMGFGLVLRADGTKFSTREGETVKLNDLLDEAKKRALQQIQERAQKKQQGEQGTTGTLLSEDQFESNAEKIGIASVKYFDLKQNRKSNYKFDYDEMLRTDGNTAIYLLYQYARLCQIIKKSDLQDQIRTLLQEKQWKITHPAERTVASLLIKYYDCLENVTDTLNIHFLTDFIYTSCQKFSESYDQYKVIDPEFVKQRVLLIEALRLILRKSLFLVGIEPLEKM